MSRYFLDGPDTYVSILENSVMAPMIEKKSAVDNLEAILDVGGIDMVQFGAADFSMNLGIPGQGDDPEVTAARNRVIRTSLKMGVHPKDGLHSPEDARRYREMGVRHFILGGDLGIPLGKPGSRSPTPSARIRATDKRTWPLPEDGPHANRTC